MKKLLLGLLLLSFSYCFAQKEEGRILNIKNQLTALSVDTPGLTENVKTEIQVVDITLANFLLAVSELHHVNINVSSDLNQPIKNNFSNVSVAELLVFLCKEYNLTIDFTGNILSVKPYQKSEEELQSRVIPIGYNPNNNTISIDIKGDKLYDVFRAIIDETRKNLVFSSGLENKSLTAYIKNTSFDAAMDKLAYSNNLFVERTKDGFYLFENGAISNITSKDLPPKQRPIRRRNSNFFFKVLDQNEKLLEVDFTNTPIADIINDIGNALEIDIFTASPLDAAGVSTFKAKSIRLDDLLTKIFETQAVVYGSALNNSNTNNQSLNNRTPSNIDHFTFKKEGDIYFFGTESQLSVRKVEIIYLQNRSVELLADPSGGIESRSVVGQGFNTSSYGNSYNQFDNINRNQSSSSSRNSNGFNRQNVDSKSLLEVVPEEIIQDLQIKVDYELNSFYVNGSSTKIERFKNFINQIDKPVPVVLIEVMFIEVNTSNAVETGVEWGIGDSPTETQGGIYPETDLTLGAETINSILGGFDSFVGFNVGQVVPNFFSRIKALETNGNIKIRSTPKLATLSGHRATFSNGQTSYYAVTQRNIYGTDNPQTSEITNYLPIDAQLGLTIKPLVSGNGEVLLDINVIQSSFGSRIAEDAPPDINSRTFSSIIRMQDQDLAVLGGLEEQMNNESGSGVPFLARVPIIKWLFSKKVREASKSKLTVLIKPTIFY